MQNQPDIYTVSRLNQDADQLLEHNFGTIYVAGELSNITLHRSGHWYFSLKDKGAQIRCTMFHYVNKNVYFTPEAGLQVRVKAKVGVYKARGTFQLNITQMDIAGQGDLQCAFEQLKQRLAQAGLFANEHKQNLPKLPKCIGVITSTNGAAIHDILTVLKRRFTSIPVIIYPCLVQGDKAATSILNALKTAQQRAECDVLILARGGGSLEDLWPFNDEAVGQAIFDHPIPIVSGVGHEVDVTITDFVADQRAATPSAAAELVSPEQREYIQAYQRALRILQQALRINLRNKQQQLNSLSQRLPHPRRQLQSYAQQLDYLQTQLIKTWHHQCRHRQQQLQELARTLDAFSPLATLNRGYSIVFKGDQIVRNVKQVKKGNIIKARLVKGEITATVNNCMTL